MLVTVGNSKSVHCLIIEDFNGSKTQDLMSSSFMTVKVERVSSVTRTAESIRAFFFLKGDHYVSLLVVKKVANSSASIESFSEGG